MILDIFSSFDPNINSIHAIYSSYLFWLLTWLSLIIFSSSSWALSSNLKWTTSPIFSVINSQASRTTGTHIKGFNNIIVALFSLIIIINFIGLVPFVFRFRSHLLFTLTFGLPLWLSLILSRIHYDTTRWAASLLPGGAPDWLNPFLVIIETVRILVRPLTLSFRLAANISAGHIVLALIGTYAATAAISRLINFSILFLIQILYIRFEIGICLIQAYIFCLLLSLYADDHPIHH